jgi:hypothetical protein
MRGRAIEATTARPTSATSTGTVFRRPCSQRPWPHHASARGRPQARRPSQREAWVRLPLPQQIASEEVVPVATPAEHRSSLLEESTAMFDPGPGTWSFRKQPRSRAGCLRPAPGSKKSSFRGRCVMLLGPLRAHRSPPDLGRRVRSEAAVPPRQKTSGPAETRQSRTDLRRCGSVFKRGPAVGPHTAAGTHFFREAGDAFSRTFLSYWL